jgi:hypothetical protein
LFRIRVRAYGTERDSAGSRRSFGYLPEGIFGDRDRRHRLGQAGIKGEVRDRFTDLVACQAILQPTLDVEGKLIAVAVRGPCRDRDETTVTCADVLAPP